MSEKRVNGHALPRELAATPHYLVLSRRRATLLFGQLLADRERIDRLERRRDSLAEQLDGEANLLVHALHELALLRKEKEPQLFIRKWLSDHRDVNANGKEGGEARVGA